MPYQIRATAIPPELVAHRLYEKQRFSETSFDPMRGWRIQAFAQISNLQSSIQQSCMRRVASGNDRSATIVSNATGWVGGKEGEQACSPKQS
jgi:hypothetical protein